MAVEDNRTPNPAFVAVGTLVALAPPAQIRTCRIAAYGSYLGYLASKRRLGWGCKILALGIHRSTNGQNRSHAEWRRFSPWEYFGRWHRDYRM